MTIEEIIQNNIEIMKHTPRCEHDIKGMKKIEFLTDRHKMIYRKCKLCKKYIVCPDPEWIKYHGPEGRG